MPIAGTPTLVKRLLAPALLKKHQAVRKYDEKEETEGKFRKSFVYGVDFLQLVVEVLVSQVGALSFWLQVHFIRGANRENFTRPSVFKPYHQLDFLKVYCNNKFPLLFASGNIKVEKLQKLKVLSVPVL
jgi:hypothetical protein